MLTTSSGAPLFCLAYVMPLHCEGARRGTTAIAFLDVHRSLPYMQKQMEARGLADCDLYTFVKFSLLNCLITDPSSPNPAPERRNPIVFASAGFGVMCGCRWIDSLAATAVGLMVANMGRDVAQESLEALFGVAQLKKASRELEALRGGE